MNNTENYVHCSFDLVDEFVPRIPQQRIEGALHEDDSIPRICVSTDVRRAVMGIPQAGPVVDCMQRLGLPVIVHAYYMTCGNVYRPDAEEVPDVELTNEHWLLERPECVWRKDYLVTECRFKEITDVNNVTALFITDLFCRETGYQDNIENLCSRFHIDSARWPSGITFRQFIANCGVELLRQTGSEGNKGGKA